jgi:hypothetical protein
MDHAGRGDSIPLTPSPSPATGSGQCGVGLGPTSTGAERGGSVGSGTGIRRAVQCSGARFS